MNILVCIKQVPETDARIDVTAGGCGVRVPDDAWRMNRWDACALTAAVELKAAAGLRAHVHAVTVGPARADAVLRRAMGVGADGATHLCCEDDPLAASRLVSHWLAHWVRTRPCDLILCGAISEDMMQGCTGPMLAERLGWPVAAAAVRVSPVAGAAAISVEKEVDGGIRVDQTLQLPAVVTIQSGYYAERYPALSRMLRASGATIDRITVTPRVDPGQTLFGIGAPSVKSTARFLEGTPLEQAGALTRFFVQRGWQ